MKWFTRTRRKVCEPAAEPGAAITLPLELHQAVTRLAQYLRCDPAALANKLLREAIEHRWQVESVQGRWQSLSPREREIAGLAVSGLSNIQIAEQLCISPETVKHHLISALHKLGLPGKAQLREALEGINREELD